MTASIVIKTRLAFHDPFAVVNPQKVYLTYRLRSFFSFALSAIEQRDLRDYWLIISSRPELNAYVCGKRIFVFTESLVAYLPDNYLLAVIAHELGHDEASHHMKRADRSWIVLLGAGIAGLLVKSPILFFTLLGGGSLLHQAYNRDEELEADKLALLILERLGYGKEDIIGLLRWLKQHKGDNSGILLDTHPSFSERIEQLARLTEPNDLVLDPFAGSNVTGEVCERLGRRWVSIELIEDYLKRSKYRFSEFCFEDWEEYNGQRSFFIREDNSCYRVTNSKKAKNQMNK